MNKLIVGIGNPGEKYVLTRHNIGFMFVDLLALELNAHWKSEKKFTSVVAHSGDIILAKPQTYVNLTGSAVKRIVDYFGIPVKNVIVIQDDVDLEIGVIKYHESRGSAGHHGIDDIIEKLGSNEFLRIRIGIGRPENNKFDVKDYVLSKLSTEEKKNLETEVKKFLSNKVYS